MTACFSNRNTPCGPDNLTPLSAKPTLAAFSDENMSAASPITRQTVGTTFTAALAVLGLGVLVQMGAVGWAFIARYHAPAEGGEMPLFARLTSPVGMRPDFSTDPFSTTLEEPPPAGAEPGAAGLPRKPVPVPCN